MFTGARRLTILKVFWWQLEGCQWPHFPIFILFICEVQTEQNFSFHFGHEYFIIYLDKNSKIISSHSHTRLREILTIIFAKETRSSFLKG